MPRTLKNWPWVCLIAFIAEVLVITWRWGHSPTHRLRDWYEGSFQVYFLDWITPWLITFSVLTVIWLLVIRIRKKQDRV